MKLRTLGLASVLCAAALMVVPASASAITPRYAAYAGCPDIPAVTLCIRSETRAGHLQIGATDTPITQTIFLVGGLKDDGRIAYNSSGGLSGNALEVPGGLAGLTGLSEILINILTLGANRVYARAELVSEPAITADGLQLPVRVNLINPFIRPGCGIGSSRTPLVLNLTTGITAPPPPNRPIEGRVSDAILDPRDSTAVLIPDEKLVDNSFAAPAASGCDLLGFGLISGLINARVRLPSAAGRNEAVLDHTDLHAVQPMFVYP